MTRGQFKMTVLFFYLDSSGNFVINNIAQVTLIWWQCLMKFDTNGTNFIPTHWKRKNWNIEFQNALDEYGILYGGDKVGKFECEMFIFWQKNICSQFEKKKTLNAICFSTNWWQLEFALSAHRFYAMITK